jgi:hypothetical protein
MSFQKVISADSHVMEPRDLWQKALGERYGDHTPRIIPEHAGRKGTFFYTGRQVLKVTESDLEAQKIGFRRPATIPKSASPSRSAPTSRPRCSTRR